MTPVLLVIVCLITVVIPLRRVASTNGLTLADLLEALFRMILCTIVVMLLMNCLHRSWRMQV